MASDTDYQQDFHAWSLENARLLRAGRFAEIDAANIAEELESMGRSEREELINRLTVLLGHLLKWRFEPQLRGKSWRATIKEQRRRIERRLAKSPSLKHGIDDSFEEAYDYAILLVVRETPLEEKDLPADCPFTLDQTLDEDFWPN